MPKASKPERAPIGVALIARDAAETLPACLSSIRPYVEQIVVGVDELTRDKTAKVARKYGADVVRPIRVSDWHECARHGKVLAQHFANARNTSFGYLDQALPWWGWLDSDDVLRGGEHLAMILRDAPAFVCGVWLPYHYATMNGGAATNTLFDRERLLRREVGWTWQYRVHEVVVPGKQPTQWLRADQAAVYHQEGAHKTDSSALRNLLLLEIDLEDDPNDSRATFYMGNQYFAMGAWPKAAFWYERLTRGLGKNPYELWQSYCYLSMAYENMQDLDGALKAAFGALEVAPYHPEPYYRLARIYFLTGEHEKVRFWTEQGRRMKEPPFFVFKNPMDYSFNHRLLLADSLAQEGMIEAARQELEQAHRAFPEPKVAEAITRYKEIEGHAQRATAFVDLASVMGAEWAAREGPGLPPEVREFGRARDVYVPALLQGRSDTQPRVVFYCGRSIEPWSPITLNTTGIGGSETAVVQIARRFARDGWRVDVFNGPGREEGIHDEGVGYWEPERYDGSPADLFVGWRDPDKWQIAPAYTPTVLWCHDLNYGAAAAEHMGLWDRALGVSAWHADMLSRYYPDVPKGVWGHVPNGIDLTRFETEVKKVPMRCVYASSPDRGLLRLLHLWPRIVEGEPGAELHIAYGWQVLDALAQGRPWLRDQKTEIERVLKETPQIVWRDRLPQDALAQLYSESYAWLYPAHFLEVSAISAIEAMAGGAVPVCSDAGALKETVGKWGILVPGQPHSRTWIDFYVNVARGVLQNPDLRKPMEYAGRVRAKQLTWDLAYQKWQEITEALLTARPSEPTPCQTEFGVLASV